MRLVDCYLEDLCTKPVNHLDLRDPERLQARQDGIAPLSRRIKPFTPEVAVVVIKAIVPGVTTALAQAGHDQLIPDQLPFPARHRDRYVAELAELLVRWRRRRVF